MEIHKFDSSITAQKARFKIMGLREEMELRFLYENADDIALIGCDDPLDLEDIYPLCNYAKMNKVPNDVKPDWLAGVKEMIFIIFEAPANEPDSDRSPEICEIARINNIRFASKVLQNLHQRFGNVEGHATCYEEYIERKTISQKKILATIIKSLDDNREDDEIPVFKV